MQIVAVPVLGVIFNILLQCIEANLTLDFKVSKVSASHKPANCNVANTTYAHGETFKLDCKTQCVCENGRHACSSLCPKEQLPAPEDTISCRSPRLVEVPGHCCKMWLCENPTADVYATCHNSSTSPWTPCSRLCGLGISTRFTTTTAGCNQLSNLRLCENRKCETQQGNIDKQRQDERLVQEQKYLMKRKQLKHKLIRQHQQQRERDTFNIKHQQQVQQEHLEQEHRIRKGHECRSLQRLGPARIRLGQCVSKKLYRPKICGRCHQNTKCCVPSVSTTIQVELLCPLNAMDPISFVQQQLNAVQQQGQLFYPKTSTSSDSLKTLYLTSLWDTHSLDAIDQEYLRSHQIQIANKFIAVEWILKCECTNNDNCQRIVNTTTISTRDDESSHRRDDNTGGHIKNHKYHDYADNENVETANNNNNNMHNINYFKLNHKNKYNYNNSKRKNLMFYKDYKQQPAKVAAATQIYKIPDDNTNVDEHDEQEDVSENEDNADNDSKININNSFTNSNSNSHIHRFNHTKQTKDYVKSNKRNNNNMINNPNNVSGGVDDDHDDVEVENEIREEKEWSTSLLSAALSSSSLSSASGAPTSSDEIQPDIIPYPPPPFSANKHTSNHNNNINNNNKSIQTKWIKEKFKPEHSKQNKQQQQQQHQQYEHWFLQKYSNIQPYQPESLAT